MINNSSQGVHPSNKLKYKYNIIFNLWNSPHLCISFWLGTWLWRNTADHGLLSSLLNFQTIFLSKEVDHCSLLICMHYFKLKHYAHKNYLLTLFCVCFKINREVKYLLKFMGLQPKVPSGSSSKQMHNSHDLKGEWSFNLLKYVAVRSEHFWQLSQKKCIFRYTNMNLTQHILSNLILHSISDALFVFSKILEELGKNLYLLSEQYFIQPACFGAGCYIEMATSYH